MHAFQRIFWKESRAQWQVWAGLLAGIFLIQGVLTGSHLLDRRTLDAGAVAGLFIAAVVVGVCYAAASAAILIAGEREDETDFLLRTFPIPRLALIGGKLAFTISSLLALVAVGFASATFLGGFSGETQRFGPSDLGNFARSMAGALVWGLFFSLLVDRVMMALGLAITMEIFVVGILGNFVIEVWRDPTYWGIVAVVLAVDLGLASRWAEGKSLFSDQAASGGIPWPWGRVDAAAAPQSTRWRRLLRWFVSSGSPETRATGSLLWRELRGAVPFMAVWGAAGFIVIDLAMRFRIGFPVHFIYLHLTPVVCGLMTALGDQRRGTYCFLADHGVSPLRVWNVKIVTWLLVAVLMTAFFGGYDVMFAGRLVDAGRGPLMNATWPVLQGIASEVRTPLQRTLGEPALASDIWNFLLSLGLLLFAVGQWASFLFRRPVVSGAIAVGLGGVTIAWHYAMVVADVPLALGTYPLSVILLAATAWEVFPWMLGRSEKRLRLKEALIVALPLLCVLTAVRAWRIAAIPFVPNPTVEQSLAAPRSPWTLPKGPGNPSPTQVAIDLRDPAFPLRDASARTLEIYFDFRNPDTPPVIYAALSSRSRSHVLTQLVEMADILVSKTEDVEETPSSTDGQAAPLPDDLPVVIPAAPIDAGPDIEARPARPAEKFDPATLPARWDGLCDLLAAAEFSATTASDWDEWARALEARQRLFRSMRQWGRLEGQKTIHLDAAITHLRQTRLCVSPIDMLHRRNAQWQRTVDTGVVPGPGGQTSLPLMFRVMTSLTGERSRSIRLVNALTSADLVRETYRPADPDWLAIVDDPRVDAERRRLAGWVASSFLIPPSSYYDPMLNESWARMVDVQFQNQAAARAGTILCLLLQRYRLEHGDFPADLATAMHHLNPPMNIEEKLLHDPYCGAEYQYRAGGFPSVLHIPPEAGQRLGDEAKIIPAGQPLLWSVGPGHSSIDRTHPAGFYMERSRGRGRQVPYGPILFNDVEPQERAGEVRFLILPP